MREGTYLVFDCPVCGDLHPTRFDGYAGIDGDYVVECPDVGRLELSRVGGALREVVAVLPETS